MIASVQGIVAEREAMFAKTGLDMDEVRRRKFSDEPQPVPVAGGDVVLVIDGWATFATEYPQLVDHMVALCRAAQLRRARGDLAHQLSARLQAGPQTAGHCADRAAADRPG